MILMNNYNKYKNAQDYLTLYQTKYDDIKYNLEKEKLGREVEKHKLDIQKLELDIKNFKRVTNNNKIRENFIIRIVNVKNLFSGNTSYDE